MFFDLPDIFLFRRAWSLNQNVFAMKVVEETFRQLLQMVWCLWFKLIFLHIDEDFEINGIRPKFLSLILTGNFCIGVTERCSQKKS